MSKSTKAIVITGCSRGGIGNALAREFHARGLRVLATARSLEKVADLKELGIKCLSLDVDDHESVLRCYEDVKSAVGDGDLAFLVNNAGLAHNQPAIETSLAKTRAIFETNLFGVMDMNQVFLPLLRKGKGTIVHVGSVASIAPVPWTAVYCASKAALYAYCDTLRLEVAPLGVKVMYIQTAMVETQMTKERTPVAEDSLFASIRKPYEDSRSRDGPKGMASEAYAREVVGKLLGPASWWHHEWVLWAGDQVTPMRIISWLAGNCPWDLWGYVMNKTYKLA